MKDFKKYFFETLIQLAVLANVFRENSRHTEPLNTISSRSQSYLGGVFQTIEINSTSTSELDYLLLNDNQYSIYQDVDNNSVYLNDNRFIAKEAATYLNDIRLLQRFNNRLDPRRIIGHNNINNNFLFVAPASFSYANNNQKELSRLSETRLLLNSIEANLNNNQFNKEDLEMDIDIQTIIQQDIDLGIEKSLCYDIECLSKNSEKGFFPTDESGATKDGLKSYDFFKEAADLRDFENENQKNLDILSASNFFQREISTVPLGYKLILEEDTGEWFLTMINDDNGPINKTNNENMTMSLEPIEIEVINVTNTNNKRQPIDIKCQHSIFLNNCTTDEQSYGQSYNNHRNVILTPPISDEDSSSSNDEELGQKAKTATQPPKFLSLTSVNLELSKLDTTDANENLSDQLSETNTRIDDLLLFNDSWLDNYFGHSGNNNNNENENQLTDDQLNSQINYINNNKSLQIINRNESILKSQEDQFDYPASDQVAATDQIENSAQNILSKDTNLTISMDNFLLDEDFLKNIEDNIQIYEENNENQGSNYDAFDLMLNQELLKHEQLNTSSKKLSVVETTTASQLFSDSNANEQEMLSKTYLKHKAFASLTVDDKTLSHNGDLADGNEKTTEQNSMIDNFDCIYLKQEKVEITNNSTPSVLVTPMPTTTNKTRTANRNIAIEGLRHNHTYLKGVDSESDSFHPYSYKNKLKRMLTNIRNQNENQEANGNSRQYETRDELLLREKSIRLTLSQVVDSNAEDFNELLKASSDLTQDQINLIKDIRRRGKNKVAAQICRKRKIDSIDSLKEDVEQLNQMKSILQSEYELIHKEIHEMTNKFDILYQDTIGNATESSDPILVFLNNLKSQLDSSRNSNKNGNLKRTSLNSEESDSLGFDDSATTTDDQTGDLEDRFYNEQNDEDEDENEYEEIDDDDDNEEDIVTLNDDDDEINEESRKLKNKSNIRNSKFDSDKLPMKKFKKY
jgi:hypothetical protein